MRLENLAERFHIHLEKIDSREEERGPNKALLKVALDQACQFFHFCLLHTIEGHHALQYLYDRAIDLQFIRNFQLGLAPKSSDFLFKYMQEKKINENILLHAGLLVSTKDGKWRDFFF